MRIIVPIIFAGLLMSLSGCGKKEPIKPDEKPKVLETEKALINAIIEKDKKAFLKCYADNIRSQTFAANCYEFTILYRELFLLINNKFGKDGWLRYKEIDYGSGFLWSTIAELAPENVDEYVQSLKIDIRDGKAIILTPGHGQTVYRKQKGRIVLFAFDEINRDLLKEKPGGFHDSFRAAVKEAKLPQATIKSIAKAYGKVFYKDMDGEMGKIGRLKINDTMLMELQDE